MGSRIKHGRSKHRAEELPKPRASGPRVTVRSREKRKEISSKVATAAGQRCVFGYACRHGTNCRGNHTREEAALFVLREEKVAALERGAGCAYCQAGVCAYGDRCRGQTALRKVVNSGRRAHQQVPVPKKKLRKRGRRRPRGKRSGAAAPMARGVGQVEGSFTVGRKTTKKRGKAGSRGGQRSGSMPAGKNAPAGSGSGGSWDDQDSEEEGDCIKDTSAEELKLRCPVCWEEVHRITVDGLSECGGCNQVMAGGMGQWGCSRHCTPRLCEQCWQHNRNLYKQVDDAQAAEESAARDQWEQTEDQPEVRVEGTNVTLGSLKLAAMIVVRNTPSARGAIGAVAIALAVWGYTAAAIAGIALMVTLPAPTALHVDCRDEEAAAYQRKWDAYAVREWASSQEGVSDEEPWREDY